MVIPNGIWKNYAVVHFGENESFVITFFCEMRFHYRNFITVLWFTVLVLIFVSSIFNQIQSRVVKFRKTSNSI